MTRRQLTAITMTAMVMCLATERRPAASGAEFQTSQTFNVSYPFFQGAYIRGELGIVKPTFGLSRLLMAYRTFSGLSPVAAPVQGQPAAGNPYGEFWDAAAKVVPGSLNRSGSERMLENYQSFTNCPSDAWAAALETLNARAMRYGPSSREVAEWLRGQIDVFRNCDGTAAIIPAAPPDWADAMLRADREYQTAAAHFYALQFDEAERRFRAIAANRLSPWQPYGTYLAARSLIRRATVLGGPQQAEWLTRAEADLRGVLADAAAARLHASARGLLNFVAARVRPDARLHELAERLASSPTLTADDYADYVAVVRLDGLVPAASDDDVTDWIATVRGGRAAGAHALARWRQNRASRWLVAALWTVPPAAVPRDVEQAAAAIPRTSAAYPTVLAWRLRLLVAQGRVNELDALLRTLPTRQDARVNAELLNVIRAARLSRAGTFPMFLDQVMRSAALDGDALTSTADDDAAVVFNRFLPLDRWIEAASTPSLPKRLRIRLAQVAFARATVLGRADAVQRLAPILFELAPSMRRELSLLQGAADETAKSRAAALLLIRTPGMKLALWGLDDGPAGGRLEPGREYDFLEGFWWCSAEQKPRSDLTAFLFDSAVAAPPFVSVAEREAAAAEGKTLTQRANAPEFLSAQALAWARESPDDSLIPELLSRVVKGWRYAHCERPKGSTLAKQAFTLLHARYPRSEWARQTPYWY